jgi:hypothetical protein
MEDINNDIIRIKEFRTESLTTKIADLEAKFRGANFDNHNKILGESFLDSKLLESAFLIKDVSKQINVVIHTLGILMSLSDVLTPGESIESLSLGAGNSGSEFDLVTSLRVCEYKFIQWQGNDANRLKELFLDFYKLGEYKTSRKKELYVLGEDIPMKFLRGGRTVLKVLDKKANLMLDYTEKYGDKYPLVRDYYEYRTNEIKIIDLRSLSPHFAQF